ncbi:MAG TPA: Hsp20/alpha crystallin family protein [Bacteroidia bacterium]|jgi:HSP20 family protein|nr:Hsp20/alpha crystallin family protein [Bacteroidia bacterium]
MTLIKWNKPANGLEKRTPFVKPFEDFFSEFFNSDLMQREYASFVPSVNIKENTSNYSIEVNAPGFNKADFKVQISDGVLSISAEHENENTKTSDNFVRKEFNYGSFSRNFTLGDLVNEDKIAATYENGILKLELPKKESKQISTKQIKVE